jgi:hypothetical protein
MCLNTRKRKVLDTFLNFAERGKEFPELYVIWRRMQSRANRSLARFPANREKYREFCRIWPV